MNDEFKIPVLNAGLARISSSADFGLNLWSSITPLQKKSSYGWLGSGGPSASYLSDRLAPLIGKSEQEFMKEVISIFTGRLLEFGVLSSSAEHYACKLLWMLILRVDKSQEFHIKGKPDTWQKNHLLALCPGTFIKDICFFFFGVEASLDDWSLALEILFSDFYLHLASQNAFKVGGSRTDGFVSISENQRGALGFAISNTIMKLLRDKEKGRDFIFWCSEEGLRVEIKSHAFNRMMQRVAFMNFREFFRSLNSLEDFHSFCRRIFEVLFYYNSLEASKFWTFNATTRKVDERNCGFLIDRGKGVVLPVSRTEAQYAAVTCLIDHFFIK